MINRRHFILSSSGLLVASKLSTAWGQEVIRDPFTLGVASGVPRPDSVLLWTRLAPEPFAGGGMPQADVQVRVRLASDENLRDTVIDQLVTAPLEDGHSIHFRANGLEPGREYWYQFEFGEFASPVGRTKTAATGRLDEFRLAFASCQALETGYYAAYRDMAEARPDLIIHLGDYIYEGGPRDESRGPVRQHLGAEIRTLWDYRNRHAQYRSDPHLQAAHAAAPWMIAPDDHEIDNNWAGYVPEDPEEQTELEFRVRRWAALKAYYEHMPIENRPQLSELDSSLQIYTSLEFGDIAKVILLDTRQYRADQPCGQDFPSADDCSARYSNDISFTGRDQERWLFGELGNSEKHWNFMAQQTWFSQFRYLDNRYNMDQWDGYPAQRQQVIQRLADPNLSNPVVLSGDWHCGCAMNVMEDFDSAVAPKVAAELAGTSISSMCPWAGAVEESIPENPHVQYFSGDRRGYVLCDMNRERLLAQYRLVEDARDPDSVVQVDVEMVVESGQRGFAA